MSHYPGILLFAIALTVLASCSSEEEEFDSTTLPYRQQMRDFVIGISEKAKSVNSGFLVIPQNGIELVVESEENPTPSDTYLAAIDGHGQEDFLYGYDNDNDATPSNVTSYLKTYLDMSKAAGNTILVTDYCWESEKMANSYQMNSNFEYLSFAAPERDLNVIPQTTPNNVNSNVIMKLSDASNFLYLINPDGFNTKEEFVTAVAETNYDIVIIDLFYNGDALTTADVNQLKNKANGGKRLVIAYMSIGEAEDYRYYWNTSWDNSPPDWMATENPDWAGNFKVNYWSGDWQGIIYRNTDSYLSKITNAGFNGVYLDIIDAFEYFEGTN